MLFHVVLSFLGKQEHAFTILQTLFKRAVEIRFSFVIGYKMCITRPAYHLINCLQTIAQKCHIFYLKSIPTSSSFSYVNSSRQTLPIYIYTSFALQVVFSCCSTLKWDVQFEWSFSHTSPLWRLVFCSQKIHSVFSQSVE